MLTVTAERQASARLGEKLRHQILEAVRVGVGHGTRLSRLTGRRDGAVENGGAVRRRNARRRKPAGNAHGLDRLGPDGVARGGGAAVPVIAGSAMRRAIGEPGAVALVHRLSRPSRRRRGRSLHPDGLTATAAVALAAAGGGVEPVDSPRRGRRRHRHCRPCGGPQSCGSRSGRGRKTASGGERSRRGQLLAQPREVLPRATAPLVELEEGHARAALQDPARQSRQDAGRADLDERPHTGGVELLDRVDPADGLRHLPNEARPHVGRGLEAGCGRAPVGRDPRRPDGEPRDRLGQAARRGLEERRVKRAGNGQSLRADAAGFEDGLDGVDHPRRSTSHELLWCVLRTDPDMADERLERRPDRRPVGDDRKHGAIARTEVLHRLGAGPRRGRPFGGGPGGVCRERGKLAEAVAGDHIGREAQAPEHLPGEPVAEVHRPLRVPDLRAQSVDRPPGDLGECLTAGLTSDRVEPQETLPRFGRLLHEPPEHVCVLRSLAGEDRGHQRTLGGGGSLPAGRLHRVRSVTRRADRLGTADPVVENEVADLPLLDDGHAAGPVARLIDGPEWLRRRRRLQALRLDGPAGQSHRGGHGALHDRVAELRDGRRARRRAGVPDLPVERARHRRALRLARLPGVLTAEHDEFLAALGMAARHGHLDRPHGRRNQARPFDRLADDPSRRLGPRPPRSDADASDHAANPVARRLRVGQPLEHEDHRALAGDVASPGLAVEHRDGLVREEAAERPPFIGHEVHAPLAGGAEHGVARPLAEHVDRGGDRRQARAVACVQGQGPAHQVESLREPAGQRAAGEAAGLVDERRHLLEQLLFVERDDPIDVERRHAAAGERGPQDEPGLREP